MRGGGVRPPEGTGHITKAPSDKLGPGESLGFAKRGMQVGARVELSGQQASGNFSLLSQQHPGNLCPNKC